MFVVVSTSHSAGRTAHRSVLTKFIPLATFQPCARSLNSRQGTFMMSLHTEPSPITGMPPGGPFVIVWGAGRYRHGDANLAVVPMADLTGQGTGSKAFRAVRWAF